MMNVKPTNYRFVHGEVDGEAHCAGSCDIRAGAKDSIAHGQIGVL
jgi:hypothetical protein